MTKSKTGKLHIGTSGWNYTHWKGPFYPEDLPVSKWLSYYTEQFATVEINNSFYHLPSEKTFTGWREKTPPGFLFSVKASRFITHMKKLKDPDEPVSTFLRHAGQLAEKLGPILFQLPPKWKRNPDRLQAFLDVLPEDHRYTFEFRDESWWDPEILARLRDRNMAFCLFELGGKRTPEEITADFVYIRQHVPDGPYAGQYDDPILTLWAERLRNWADRGMDVYCYFDNDQYGYAARDALRLRELTADGVE